jgi:hypothetical protein
VRAPFSFLEGLRPVEELAQGLVFKARLVWEDKTMENQTTKVQFDIMFDDFATPWAALVDLWSTFETDEVLNIRRLPDIGIWPTFEVEFITEEFARKVIAKYLDVPDPFDAEITEYLQG